MIYFVAVVVGLAGLLFGFDEGVIAGALEALRLQFDLSAFSEGLMTAAVPLGALFGALFGGPMSGRFGRRFALLFAAGLFTAGAIAAGLSTSVWMLTACRLILGLAVGIAAIVAPLYISEVAPASRRGLLVSAYQLAITAGILAAYLVNYALQDQWREMFSLGALPGIAMFLGVWLLPDTPRWHVLKGNPKKAAIALQRLRGKSYPNQDIERELNDIQGTLTQQKQRSARWSDLLSPSIRPAFVVGIGLFLLQQFSGINAVIYYAPTVFREAGFDSTSTQLAATIGVGVINVLMTLVGMALIDRIGRRKLLYLGFVGTTLSLGLIAIGAVTGAQSLDVLAVIGLFGYIAAFAASIGPLPWVMMSEIFPSRTRGLAMSVTSFSNWTFNFLVVFSFPVLVSFAGLGAVFGLYATVCAIGIYFTWRFVPETSGLTLEAIEKHLLSGMPFAALNGQPEIQLTTDKPDITQAKCAELTSALIKLSPYRSTLEPLSTEIASVAFNNQQIRTSLREIYARQSVQQALAQGKPLSKWMLGSHGTVVFVFLEHIRFASPSFLASVGEQS